MSPSPTHPHLHQNVHVQPPRALYGKNDVTKDVRFGCYSGLLVGPKCKQSPCNWKNLSTVEEKSSLVAQTVKNLPAMKETWIQSLGQEDALEKGMSTHSSILAWRIPSIEELAGLRSMGSWRVRHDWALSTPTEERAWRPWRQSLKRYIQGMLGYLRRESGKEQSLSWSLQKKTGLLTSSF